MSQRKLLGACLAAIAAVTAIWWMTPPRLAGAAAVQARVTLGRNLFADASLSADRKLACTSCHDPEHAFAQTVAVPTVYGTRTGTRNVPSLLDLPYFTQFFWDGRESHLDQAVVAAFTNRAEMAQPGMGKVIDTVSAERTYRRQFELAFGNDRVDQAKISAALLAYLGSVTQPHSRYDAFAEGNKEAMTPAELRGLAVFAGKAECASCHSLEGAPATFTDNRFHHSNVGLERMAGRISTTIAAFQAKRQEGIPMAELVLSNPDMAALGRFAVSGRGSDLAAYRTPTLRNVTRTHPYMHDGSVESLDEAIQREIYYRSLSRGAPISLTVDEQSDLRAFLHALEDQPRPFP